MSDRLMTAEEVAEILGVTPRWVLAEARSERLPVVVLGRYRRFRREAVEAWIEEQEVRGPRTKTRRGQA